MQRIVGIAAFACILFATIAALIGEQRTSIEPTVPNEAVTISQGEVEGPRKMGDSNNLDALAVVTGQVVHGKPGDGWPPAEGAMRPVHVVEVEPAG